VDDLGLVLRIVTAKYNNKKDCESGRKKELR